VNKEDNSNEKSLLRPIIGIQTWPAECCLISQKIYFLFLFLGKFHALFER
jgi:hypothetical protein